MRVPLRRSSSRLLSVLSPNSPLCSSDFMKVIPPSRSVMIPHFHAHIANTATLTWRAHREGIARRLHRPLLENYARTAGSHNNTAYAYCIYKEPRKGCVTSVKWMSAGKQQLQYNLMGNKFPFLLSTWPPATNPGAWRVVNFHGKVVNFHKQPPFLSFRHAFSSPSLFFSKAWNI